MINDAHLGKFKLIITKEVSRFSRNILDTISYTRELKQIGVGVLFMNEGISTLEPDAELRQYHGLHCPGGEPQNILSGEMGTD